MFDILKHKKTKRIICSKICGGGQVLFHLLACHSDYGSLLTDIGLHWSLKIKSTFPLEQRV